MIGATPLRGVDGLVGTGLLILVSATRMFGQQLDRSIRPVTQPPPAFRAPVIRTHTLANGLRLLVVEDHSVPVVAVRAIVAADSLRDPVGKEGLYAVTLGALREGSAKRGADELADAAASIGTNVTPTGFTTISSAFEPALQLMAEMLTQPAFDSAAVERRKAIQAAAARRIAQAPVTVPRRQFYAQLYGPRDAFVRSLAPTESSVASIASDDVSRFYDSFFGPRTTTLVIVGDVSDRAAADAVSGAFGTWTAHGELPIAEQMPSSRAAPRMYVRDVPAAGTQAYVYVGTVGPPRGGPDVVAMEAYGAVATLRLQETLRDKRSFIYSATIGLTWHHGEGTFVGSAVVSAQKVDSALTEWLRVLRELRTTRPPTRDELDAVRRNRVGVLPSRFDGPDSTAARVVELVRDDLPLNYYERYAEQMSALTVADVLAAGARYAEPEQMVIVVSGDLRLLAPGLRASGLGPFVNVDPGRGSPPE